MTPEELEKLPKPLERTMTALELSVMSEIIQRIKEVSQVTPVIDWAADPDGRCWQEPERNQAPASGGGRISRA